MAEPSRDGGGHGAPGGAPLPPAPSPPWSSPDPAARPGAAPRVLLGMVLVIATTGLVYELAIAAVASYLLGDSVRQFSLVIGAYLSALGVGAYLSRHVTRHLVAAFVDVEIAAALAGGLSVPLLMIAFAYTRAFQLALFSVVGTVGVLVGLELPLLLRILERRVEFRELVARALTVDYLGALLGSIAFSLYLVPELGLAHTSAVSGLVNALVGVSATFLLPASDGDEARALSRARARAVLVTLLLVGVLVEARRVVDLSERALYPGDVVHAETSPYQRIVVTHHEGAVELFLNGNLQFSSRDEYRYHEALVHPAMAAAGAPRSVVVGGGGDGLAVREILAWPSVERVVLVDLDRRVTELARHDGELTELNRHSLDDARVTVVNEDAMRWFAETTTRHDVVVLDFPDPGTFAVGKLYSVPFYAAVRRALAPGGAVVVQASSPELAPHTFACVVRTMEAAGLVVRPYQVFVPSFGAWGFALGRTETFPAPTALPPRQLRYLDAAALAELFSPSGTPTLADVRVNRLDDQALVAYYTDEWRRWEAR